MNCITRKRCYDTQQLAEDALLHSYVRFNHRQGQGPVNIYQCEHCGCFHLTSKGEKHALLKSKSNQDRIKLGKEAYFWEEKFKKR